MWRYTPVCPFFQWLPLRVTVHSHRPVEQGMGTLGLDWSHPTMSCLRLETRLWLRSQFCEEPRLLLRVKPGYLFLMTMLMSALGVATLVQTCLSQSPSNSASRLQQFLPLITSSTLQPGKPSFMCLFGYASLQQRNFNKLHTTQIAECCPQTFLIWTQSLVYLGCPVCPVQQNSALTVSWWCISSCVLCTVPTCTLQPPAPCPILRIPPILNQEVCVWLPFWSFLIRLFIVSLQWLFWNPVFLSGSLRSLIISTLDSRCFSMFEFPQLRW